MIGKYVHHGTLVSVDTELKGLHREHCLCYKDCKSFNEEDHTKNCEIANAVFKNCVDFGIVTPVWECPKYEEETV
jgi:hypothetical protein